MDKPKATAKDFFLWFGAMIALYWSVFAFVALIFDYINHAFPDPLSYNYGGYSSSVSYEMASLVVLVPVFFVLMRIIRRDIALDPSRQEIWVRRWALVLTLFVAGVAIAGDLITLIKYFFDGDVTLSFILKVLVVLLIAGGGFMHFLADLRGYWTQHPKKLNMVTGAVGLLVLISIVAGFFIVGTPWQAREYRFDEQRVSDLQNVQWQVVNYWQAKQTLPSALTDLNDPISGFIAPRDPATGTEYEYAVLGANSFKLCAVFSAVTQSGKPSARSVVAVPYSSNDSRGNDSWQHDTGRTCFERSIDPELYPPIKR